MEAATWTDDVVQGRMETNVPNEVARVLIQGLLKVNPTQRYTMAQVLQHPYFTAVMVPTQCKATVATLLHKICSAQRVVIASQRNHWGHRGQNDASDTDGIKNRSCDV
ncbi:Aste57867_14147 [Aphanomyces stellatus]|uniref:Aste57867_14147 protein n=1 Tax=Aphanomyces stellatus TaxID=120398 RepID=A0A485L0H6_9STRA|nr:hypothetical protein As57867_014096 [Aphanomyces stellatus]VFT90973.1 Aste57867_14147 [Aphanomyces stellatus]